jgi:hypothetical protein
MTENEWLVCERSTFMTGWLARHDSDRKFYLLAGAAVRQIWDRLNHDVFRHAVETAERYADGEVSHEDLRGAYRAADLAMWANYQRMSERPPSREARRQHQAYVAATYAAMTEGAYQAGASALHAALTAGKRGEIEPRQCHLIRDIFGNPFRPVAFERVWASANAVEIARAIYAERYLPAGELDAGRLAILADAVEEAGCTEAEVLAHLRQPGLHVRGCWALDLVLGKQ